MDDAQDLFRWRNDEATRLASFNIEPVSWENHLGWLAKVLANPERELYIATIGGQPIGTVRADHEEGGYELSWTVAPEYRRLGCGKQMLTLLVDRLSGRLRAQIKAGNGASVSLVQALGFVLVKDEAGVSEWVLFR